MSAKIVVADDDADNRSIAREALEAAGHTVLIATNGIEVLSIAEKETPDLILLDMSMPKLNGWETAKRLREMPALTSVPILAFTAHALSGEDMRAKVAGCDDYIAKPCVPSDMAKKISTWLKIGEAQRALGGGRP